MLHNITACTIKVMLVLKDVKLAECLVVSSHVPTLKHEAKHGYITGNSCFHH